VHEETGLPYASTVTTKNDKAKEVAVMHATSTAAYTIVGSTGSRPANSLHLDVFPQVGRDVEIFAFDDGRFAFLEPAARHRLEL
jgi:hypothetical protein